MAQGTLSPIHVPQFKQATIYSILDRMSSSSTVYVQMRFDSNKIEQSYKKPTGEALVRKAISKWPQGIINPNYDNSLPFEMIILLFGLAVACS